jgi:hypothetical protein
MAIKEIEDLLAEWMVEISHWDHLKEKNEAGSTLKSNCGIRAHEMRRCYDQLKSRMEMNNQHES